jgi:hypothetical protein
MQARKGLRWSRCAAALLAVGAFLVDFGDLASLPSVPSAEAQYGTSRRVARRTARRTSRRQVAYAGGAYGGGPTTVVVAQPPAGCTSNGSTYTCPNNAQYQQVMDGDQVGYEQVE